MPDAQKTKQTSEVGPGAPERDRERLARWARDREPALWDLIEWEPESEVEGPTEYSMQGLPIAELLCTLPLVPRYMAKREQEKLEEGAAKAAQPPLTEKRTPVAGAEARGVRVQELTTLAQRNFLLRYNEAQSGIDSACPRIFSLVPADTSAWRKKLIGQEVTLHLWCEEPGAWHPMEGANYTFTLSAKWLRVVAPWLRGLVKVLKYAAPLAGPVVGIASPAADEALKHHIKMDEDLVKKLPDITDQPRRARGADFRALRDLLTKLDPSQHWGGLQKVITPEGHYYWVCPKHAKQAKYTRIAAPQIP